MEYSNTSIYAAVACRLFLDRHPMAVSRFHPGRFATVLGEAITLLFLLFFIKGTSDIFTHIWPHLGLTQASPGPYPGLTRASLGPHPGLMRASPGPHEGLTRASPGPHPGTQVNTG